MIDEAKWESERCLHLTCWVCLFFHSAWFLHSVLHQMFFKCQPCSKHYDGQCKHSMISVPTDFTCYTGDNTCSQIFRMKGLWGECPDNGPDKMSWGEKEQRKQWLPAAGARKGASSKSAWERWHLSGSPVEAVLIMWEGIAASWSIRDTFLKEYILQDWRLGQWHGGEEKKRGQESQRKMGHTWGRLRLARQDQPMWAVWSPEELLAVLLHTGELLRVYEQWVMSADLSGSEQMGLEKGWLQLGQPSYCMSPCRSLWGTDQDVNLRTSTWPRSPTPRFMLKKSDSTPRYVYQKDWKQVFKKELVQEHPL